MWGFVPSGFGWEDVFCCGAERGNSSFNFVLSWTPVALESIFFLAVKPKAEALQCVLCSPCCDICVFTDDDVPGTVLCLWREGLGSSQHKAQDVKCKLRNPKLLVYAKKKI